MAKAVLVFNLANEDDKYQYKQVMVCNKMHSALLDIDRHCRDELKYGTPRKDVVSHLEAIRAIIYEEVDLDEIY